MSDHTATDRHESSERLAQQLLSLLSVRWESHAMQRRVVGVAGESGSGKSMTADGLARACTSAGRRALVLNQDNYFFLPPRTNHEHRIESLDNVGAHEVNLALIGSHIAAFRARENGLPHRWWTTPAIAS